jgi:hypothetical protein
MERQIKRRRSQNRIRCTQSLEGDSFIHSIRGSGLRQGARGHPAAEGEESFKPFAGVRVSSQPHRGSRCSGYKPR